MRFRRTRQRLDRLDVLAWIGSGATVYLAYRLGRVR